MSNNNSNKVQEIMQTLAPSKTFLLHQCSILIVSFWIFSVPCFSSNLAKLPVAKTNALSDSQIIISFCRRPIQICGKSLSFQPKYTPLSSSPLRVRTEKDQVEATRANSDLGTSHATELLPRFVQSTAGSEICHCINQSISHQNVGQVLFGLLIY